MTTESDIREKMAPLEDIRKDGSLTPGQRTAARAALRELNEEIIRGAAQRMVERTGTMQGLAAKLASIVNGIRSNNITSAMDDLADVVGEENM